MTHWACVCFSLKHTHTHTTFGCKCVAALIWIDGNCRHSQVLHGCEELILKIWQVNTARKSFLHFFCFVFPSLCVQQQTTPLGCFVNASLRAKLLLQNNSLIVLPTKQSTVNISH